MCKYQWHDDNMNEGSAYAKLLKLVMPRNKVLEFGCATGYVSKIMKEKLNCYVTGIEIDPDAAKDAEMHCERVIVGSPGKILAGIRPFLSERGYIIASIPNVAHISVALELLDGRFDYRPLGLLDDSHLRFFTKKTIYSLFKSSGYEGTIMDRVIIKPEDTEFQTVLQKYPASLLSYFDAGGEALTYQFIVKAVPNEYITEKLLQKESERTVLEELRNRIEEQELLLREHRSKDVFLTSMTNSWSWRITAPLRAVGCLLQGQKRGLNK